MYSRSEKFITEEREKRICHRIGAKEDLRGSGQAGKRERSQTGEAGATETKAATQNARICEKGDNEGTEVDENNRPHRSSERCFLSRTGWVLSENPQKPARCKIPG